MRKKIFAHFNYALLFAAIIGLVFPFLDIYTPVSAATYKCDTPEEKAECTKLLNATENEIKELGAQLETTKSQGASLQRDKELLDLQIKQSQLKIKAHEITIANLGKDIVAKNAVISTLDAKIGTGKESLAQIIRKTRELDSASLPEFFLSSENLSDAFQDVDDFLSIEDAMREKFGELRQDIQSNEQAKVDLGKKRDQVIDTKVNAESEKKKIEKSEAEKKALIALNAATQSTYQQVIATKAAQAASIRSALFKLRDAEAIEFGTALTYANEVSKDTGVRPAFLLAIITQESNLGANVGSCYVTSLETGDGKGKNTGTFFEKVMAPSRGGDVNRGDTIYFKKITDAVGRDWTTTPVSCPIGSTAYYVGRGFGGGMGPAQFIPSTWNLFQGRLNSILGTSPDPWNPEHAFMASGLYLSDLGASRGGYTSEITAACKYYGTGGSACTYGTQVMAKAANIQANIDILEGN